MTFDDDLRHVLTSEAGRYDPADDGRGPISAGVRARRARRRRLQGGALGAVALAVVAVGATLSLGGGSTDVDAGPVADERPTTSEAPPETTAPPTTEVQAAVFPGIWPFASQEAVDRYADGDARFEDPVATADAFARDYLGMLDPVVGEPAGDDDGTLEVELRPRAEDGGPVPVGGASTLVTLRSYETSYDARIWTVVGATSPNIRVTEPAPHAVVTSPLTVRGTATGYEGTIVAAVRQDGMRAGESLGEAVTIAGSMGEMGPLDVDVEFATPNEPAGALVLTTDTGRDGVGVPEATVVRLAFQEVVAKGPPPTVEEPPAEEPPVDGVESCSPPAPAGEPAADEMDVTVFFHCVPAADGDPEAEETYVQVTRRGPRSAGVLLAAMETFLGGATDEEERFGVGSFTYHAAIPVDVTLVGDGTAVVDIDGQLISDANGASTSAGSVLFRGAMNRTVFQFPTVERIEYRIDGSCEAFWEWQQVGGCPLVTRDDL